MRPFVLHTHSIFSAFFSPLSNNSPGHSNPAHCASATHSVSDEMWSQIMFCTFSRSCECVLSFIFIFIWFLSASWFTYRFLSDRLPLLSSTLRAQIATIQNNFWPKKFQMYKSKSVSFPRRQMYAEWNKRKRKLFSLLVARKSKCLQSKILQCKRKRRKIASSRSFSLVSDKRKLRSKITCYLSHITSVDLVYCTHPLTNAAGVQLNIIMSNCDVNSTTLIACVAFC